MSISKIFYVDNQHKIVKFYYYFLVHILIYDIIFYYGVKNKKVIVYPI
jgi:hypothetical protein